MNEVTRIAAEVPFIVPFTARDFGAMIEVDAFDGMRVELVDGVLQKMMPSGLAHGESNARLVVLFAQAIADTGWKIAVDLAIRVDPMTVFGPDIAIYRPLPEQKSLPPASAMRIVIEIADTSIGRDMVLKTAKYAQAGVLDYWVIDLNRRRVEVFADPTAGLYQSHISYGFDAPIPVPGTDRTITID